MKEDGNFSNNPLKILLPQVGALSNLRNFVEVFNQRSLEIRVEKEQALSSEDTAREDEEEQFIAEEQMLIQVLQWLSVGDEN